MPYQMDVWTDGACRGNGQLGAVAGAAAWFSRPIKGSKGWGASFWRFQFLQIRLRILKPWLKSSQQLTGAELPGAILALELATERCAELDNDPFFILKIHTDSEYTIDCLRDWVQVWKDSGWWTVRGQQL
ncbi:hypothetical protein C8R45DRAFT_1098058 [Mycena sanguinolenta]|nr:hypothetical protein C8R45DRAFT_1098058 [Mycena sanguinolenta]